VVDQGNNGRESDEEKDAAEKVFEAMWTDVRQLRRVIEDMAAAQAKAPRPIDYSPTLGKIMDDMQAIAANPLMRVSYDDVARQVAAAGEKVKRDGSASIDAGMRALDKAAADLRDITAVARTARVQNWWVGGAALAGAIFWGVFGGAVLRATPDSWEWPEKYATSIMDMTRWETGLYFAAGGFPGGWVGMSAGRQIVAGNEQAITACQKAAEKVGKAVPCMLKVPAAET
jgi:hypothetical protein